MLYRWILKTTLIRTAYWVRGYLIGKWNCLTENVSGRKTQPVGSFS